MVSLVVLATSAVLLQSECEYTAERSATLVASASDLLHVVARGGSLRVEGRPGLREVHARGRACASNEALLDALVIEARREGGSVHIEVPNIEMDDFETYGDRYARLDLVIEVPENIVADIRDGSGGTEIRGVGQLHLEDGSGEVRIDDIRGDVDVDDGSGGLDITSVNGAVRVEDGSGGIDIRNVTGSVTVDDGSGGIDVADVGGDFIVIDDGSGGIDYRNVQGQIDIPRRERRRLERIIDRHQR